MNDILDMYSLQYYEPRTDSKNFEKIEEIEQFYMYDDNDYYQDPIEIDSFYEYYPDNEYNYLNIDYSNSSSTEKTYTKKTMFNKLKTFIYKIFNLKK